MTIESPTEPLQQLFAAIQGLRNKAAEEILRSPKYDPVSQMPILVLDRATDEVDPFLRTTVETVKPEATDILATRKKSAVNTYMNIGVSEDTAKALVDAILEKWRLINTGHLG